jgi:acetyl-CoA synthetase
MIMTRSDDIAFLNYTSGTAGKQKGVIQTHSWAIAHMESTKLWLGIEESDVVWATAAPGWAKWNWTPFISTLGNGATGLVYRGKFNPEKYLILMEKYKVNVLCCTPTEYRLMAKLDGLEHFKLLHLRHAVSAGEPLNQEVIEKFNRFFNVQVRDGCWSIRKYTVDREPIR